MHTYYKHRSRNWVTHYHTGLGYYGNIFASHLWGADWKVEVVGARNPHSTTIGKKLSSNLPPDAFASLFRKIIIINTLTLQQYLIDLNLDS